MDQLYRDDTEGCMTQTIEVTKRPDNGLFEATSGEFKATSTHSEADAVEKCSTKMREAILRGEWSSGQ